MTINHLFHFFRMHLEAPNINDSIAPANEVVAIVSQVEHVGGIHKAFRILQGAMLWIQAQEFAKRIEDGRLREPVARFTQVYESARFGNSAEDVQRLPELYEEVESATRTR